MSFADCFKEFYEIGIDEHVRLCQHYPKQDAERFLRKFGEDSYKERISIVEKYKNLDFTKLLSEFEKENGLKLPDNFKVEMQDTFLFQKEVFHLAENNLEKRLAKTKAKTTKKQEKSYGF